MSQIKVYSKVKDSDLKKKLAKNLQCQHSLAYSNINQKYTIFQQLVNVNSPTLENKSMSFITISLVLKRVSRVNYCRGSINYC